MPETFIPLVPVKNSPREGGPSPVLQGVNASMTEMPAHSEDCAKPAIKVERTGELVSSIRIECSCGQVIELACVY